MCYFITAVIGKNTNLDSLNKLGREYIISFQTCNNEYVQDQLALNEVYLAKHCKYCDCDTQLGMFTRKQSPEPFRIEEREIERLHTKGWSNTKIKRWIADRVKSREKDKAKYENLVNGRHKDVENWNLYLKKVMIDSQVEHIGILLHWYKGGIETERIRIKERKTIKFSELTEDMLLKIEEDIIYDIVRAS